MGLADRLLAGDLRALARLATHVENDDALGRAALARVYPHTGRAHVIGITGPPGAGKSTLVNALIGAFRVRGRRVGVVAVDPSSPLTGGATLGDRVRMMERHADADVFIRSMASRGNQGGIAPAMAGVVHLLDAAGFDPIFVETVGVGQDEVEIARRAHTTLLLQVPGLGDGIQTIKAGILEVGDILVVSKADRPGAGELVRDLLHMLSLAERSDAAWRVPVLRVQATTGDGVSKLADRVAAHLAHLRETGLFEERQHRMAAVEVTARLRGELERRLRAAGSDSVAFERLVDDVAARRRSPIEAAEGLLVALSTQPSTATLATYGDTGIMDGPV